MPINQLANLWNLIMLFKMSVTPFRTQSEGQETTQGQQTQGLQTTRPS